jgi:hypothetical protein
MTVCSFSRFLEHDQERVMSVNVKTNARPKIQAKARELLAYAREQARQCKNSSQFFNAIYGKGGKANELFATDSERAAFLRTGENKEIRRLKLMLPDPPVQPGGELMTNGNQGVILRLPKSVFAALLAEAEAEGVSLDQLCLSKLVAQLRELV